VNKRVSAWRDAVVRLRCEVEDWRGGDFQVEKYFAIMILSRILHLNLPILDRSMRVLR
jgi:hypothetical protein